MQVEMVSIVIPTLNEAGNILNILNTIHEGLTYPHEIIIVDGNSVDGTKEIVTKTGYCRLIIEPRRGYGLALRTGMKNARGNVIIMVDGDGTYEVKHIKRLVDTLAKNDADLVLATRMYDPNKAMGLMNFVGNKIITSCFDFAYKQFFSDTQSGFRAISRETLERIPLKETDMAYATEMLIRFAQNDCRMIEVPTIYKKRLYGQPKLRKFKSSIEIFSTMVKGLL